MQRFCEIATKCDWFITKWLPKDLDVQKAAQIVIKKIKLKDGFGGKLNDFRYQEQSDYSEKEYPLPNDFWPS